jgi:aminobenzoyl-glutamate transport protein
VAADAGYLVLIPLAGVAFLSVGRYPIAGVALGFAAVAGAFTVNMLIKPLDAVMVEFTNDAIAMVAPGMTIGLASNIWFSALSVLVLTVLLALISERIIEPRLGPYQPELAGGAPPEAEQGALSADESRGLMYAAGTLVAMLALFALLSLPAGAPLRDPDTGVGTVVSLMLPYMVFLFIVWAALFAIWHLLGLPWRL